MCKMASRARRILRLAAEKLQSESSSSNANDNRKINHSINDMLTKTILSREFSLHLCDLTMGKISIITRIDLNNRIMELPHESIEYQRTQPLQFLKEHFGTNGNEITTETLVQFTRESFLLTIFAIGKL
ncbi:hypothetical protein FQA39_LY06028 [Lamprigera yunnana]|nr:hypothetical protein FQA39_LY06028 [Lamprigera yunnana]